MRNALIMVAVWTAASVLPGCVIADDVKEGLVQTPTARVVDVAVTEQTDTGAALAMTVEVTNPNAVELPLVDLSVRLRVEGVGRFDAPDQPTVALPPRGTQRMRLTAAVPTGGGDVHGRPYTFSAAMTYQPPGELRAIMSESGVPRPFVTASSSGVLGRASGSGESGGASGAGESLGE